MLKRKLVALVVLSAWALSSVACDRSEDAAPKAAAGGKELAAAEARVKELEAEVADLRTQLASASKPAQAGAAPAAAAQSPDAKPGDAPAAAVEGKAIGMPADVRIVENTALKGVMGRIVVAFPKNTKITGTRTDIYEAGKKHTIAGGYGDYSAELIPGKYDVVVTNVRLSGVEVKSKHDSLIPVGVLKINAADSGTRVEVFAKDGKTNVTGCYGAEHIGLPAGSYKVSVAGQSMPIEIKVGEAMDF
jgi:hypothetical protein